MTAAPRVRLAIVTNIPAPYRVPVYNLLAKVPGVTLKAFYAAATEPGRRWDQPPFEHYHQFLSGGHIERAGRYIHYNPDVWSALRAFEPDVIVTTGFNPTHLMAFIFAVINGRRHVAMTDGTDRSERHLSWVHRWVRRAVFAVTPAYVVASQGGFRLLRGYGVLEARIHFSPLCANTSVSWTPTDHSAHDIDLLFSGRLVPVKNATFALEVAAGIAAKLGRRVHLAILGSGPQAAMLRTRAAQLDDALIVSFGGHVKQSDLPAWFQRARVFIFPTRWDPWGVVANEACEAGVPVIVSPHAGVAGELVRDGVNGRVLGLDRKAWIAAGAELLSDADLHARLSAQAHQAVLPYNFGNAASGIADAARQAVARSAPAAHTAALSNFCRRPRVVVVQRRLTHYRVPLFSAMREQLATKGVELVLVHGNAAPSELNKQDGGHLPWAVEVPCRYWLNERLCWQNLAPELLGADLVIVPQENRLLYNLLAMTVRRPARMAFWGHGRNFQASRPDGLRERFKRQVARNVDWWFAYTALSVQAIRATGFDPARITQLDNAVDTRRQRAECAAVAETDLLAFRKHWQLGDGPVAIFVGSLYAEKRIDFLLAAADSLARRITGFQLVVVGDGPQAHLLKDPSGHRPWLHALGPRYGAEKAIALRAAQIMLNPGLVGLGILDAFAAGLPLATTDCKLHSPEIAYLRNGENGLMTEDDLNRYVTACERLLEEPNTHRIMANAAQVSALQYTLEHMTANFCDGIMAALLVPPRH